MTEGTKRILNHLREKHHSRLLWTTSCNAHELRCYELKGGSVIIVQIYADENGCEVYTPIIDNSVDTTIKWIDVTAEYPKAIRRAE